MSNIGFIIQPVILTPQGHTTCAAGVVCYTCKVGGAETVRFRLMDLLLRALRKQREQSANPLRSNRPHFRCPSFFITVKCVAIESEVSL